LTSVRRRDFGRPSVFSLLVHGLGTNRGRPDFERLTSIDDPESFLWEVLPHAARSFAASIAFLPEDQARAAAVAYSYCRILDTYEDLITDPVEARKALDGFAGRFGAEWPGPAPLVERELARSERDRVYLVMIDRIELIDRVFAQLPELTKTRIAGLVAEMSSGMVWSTETFARQDGVLADREQLARYCRNVIGGPVLFMLEQVGGRNLSEGSKEDALEASEMIQLANVTRDIESDLSRGIAYHPALAPHLGRSGFEPEVAPVVREVRENFISIALGQAPAYRRMFEDLDLADSARVRGAAVVMLLFTDLHYRGCAVRAGCSSWSGPKDGLQVIVGALPSVLSRNAAVRKVRRVERDFTSAARWIGATASGLEVP
jgi:phytoene/squalene synthetase